MLYITCPIGIDRLLGRELQRLNRSMIKRRDTGVIADGDLHDAYKVNLRSRLASKVYYVIAECEAHSLDDLFGVVHDIDRSAYVAEGQNITIDIFGKNYRCTSPKMAQKIAHKAVLTKIYPGEGRVQFAPGQNPCEIRILLHKNTVTIMCNTSGASLHERNYRTLTGEAPIKENIASALLFQAGRRYTHPLIDPCCGSGTIVIEAAMIARNIAPGLLRSFAFERFPCHDDVVWQAMRTTAKDTAMTKNFDIIASDIDPRMIEIAKENAGRAGVADTIKWQEAGDAGDHLAGLQDHWLMTNPPYGKRLEMSEDSDLYKDLFAYMRNNTIGGGLITSYTIDQSIYISGFQKITMRNGAQDCVFYKKHR